MPDRLEELYQETLRTRERLHRLETTVAALTLRTDLMRETLGSVQEKVEGLAHADEIAAAVAERVNERRRFVLSTAQKSILFVLAFVPILNLILHAAGVGSF